MKRISVFCFLFLLIADTYANQNHLTPITAYNDDGYDQAVFKSLIGNVDAEMWMIVRPSFSAEYAIILYHEVEYKKKDGEIPSSPKITKEEWVLEKVEAKDKIFAWKDIGNRKSVLDIHPTKDLIKKKAIIKRGELDLVSKAWKAAIRGTRYPDSVHPGLDGTTYQFYSKYDLFGETWSPNDGIPKKLVESGRLLEHLLSVEKEKRTSLIVKLNNIAQEILSETKP